VYDSNKLAESFFKFCNLFEEIADTADWLNRISSVKDKIYEAYFGKSNSFSFKQLANNFESVYFIFSDKIASQFSTISFT